jgi:hypothetical protein
MSNQRNKENDRYIGKVKANVIKSQNGDFVKNTVMMENFDPQNKDGSQNQYYQGALIFVDKTGKKYLVKQIELAGVSESASNRGFINSLRINLEDPYQVQLLG